MELNFALSSSLFPHPKIPKTPINFHLEMLPGVPHGCQSSFVLSFRQWDSFIRSPFVPWKKYLGEQGRLQCPIFTFSLNCFSWRECSRGSAVDFRKFTIFNTVLLLLWCVWVYGHSSPWRMRSRITAVEKPPLHGQSIDLLMCKCLRVGDTHKSYWKPLILLHPGSPTSP